jgi:cytochrome c nitrite reductase small subunit
MRRLWFRMRPPEEWKRAVAIVSGIFIGLAIFVLYISKALSYLSDDPQTCINCHVMNPQYATWAHSSHRRVTNCNECHVPHDNFFSHYFFKAKDGLRHATIFTLRREPQVIFIKDAGRKVVRENCIRCHERVTGFEFIWPLIPGYCSTLENRSCLDCHRETPHGRVNGLSSTPNALNKTKTESRSEREEEDRNEQ